MGSATTVDAGFKGLDPSLPIEAAQAAAEVDNLILSIKDGKTTTSSLSKLPKVFEVLRRFGGFAEADTGGAKGFIDPIGGSLFIHAYNESYHQQLKNRTDLIRAAKQLIETSRTVSSDASQLEHMRDFLLALSNYAASKRQTILGNRPRHPYSR